MAKRIKETVAYTLVDGDDTLYETREAATKAYINRRLRETIKPSRNNCEPYDWLYQMGFDECFDLVLANRDKVIAILCDTSE